MHDPTMRTYMVLQGPIFGQPGRMLARAGSRCGRIGFNRGDKVFWPDRPSYIPYGGPPEDWPGFHTRTLDGKAVTDIVLLWRHAADPCRGRAPGSSNMTAIS